MDAVEYVNQRERMCSYYSSCDKCLANKVMGCASLIKTSQMVPIVEQWAKEHPVKTRQSEFLKQWPNAKLIANGILAVCPMDIMGREYVSKNIPGCINNGIECNRCKRDFWLKEIE